MEVDKVKGLFYMMVGIIPEPEIQKFTLAALEKAHSKFFQAPTSSSGKYHPCENNIIGGLTGVHTIKAGMYGHDFSARKFPYFKGAVVSACLLHDSRKGIQDNGEWTGYAPDHALKAYHWLEQFDLDPKYKNPIREGVRTHMHDLTEPEEEKELACREDLPKIQDAVQYADIAASTMWGSYIPGVDVRTLLEYKVEGLEEANEEKRQELIKNAIDKFMNLDNLEYAISKTWGATKRERSVSVRVKK